MKVRRLRRLQMDCGRPHGDLKGGGGVAEVSCAFLFGGQSLAIRMANHSVCQEACSGGRNLGKKRLCPGCPGQSIPFKRIQGYWGCGYSLQ